MRFSISRAKLQEGLTAIAPMPVLRHAARVGESALMLALLLPGTVSAQQLGEFCPDRPGLGTPACTIDRGHAAIELGLLDWTLDKQPTSRTGTLLVSDLLIRVGITDRSEAQIGWVAFGQVRSSAGGLVEHSRGSGDVLLAVRHTLRRPDGDGVAIAAMPYATLSTGGSAIGAGDWGAGFLLPISRELQAGLQVGLTGKVEAAVDEDRSGRHMAYGIVAGLDVPIGAATGATFELSATRDNDATHSSTELLGGISATWSPTLELQFDVGANVGLNRFAPEIQLYVGVARRY